MKISASRKNNILPSGRGWLMPSLLFLGMTMFGGDVLVSAEHRMEVKADSILFPKGDLRLSMPFTGTIHGSGYLNFAELNIDVAHNSDGTDSPPISLDAAIVYLKRMPRDPLKFLSKTIGRVEASDGFEYTCCTTASQKLMTADGKNNLCEEDQIGQLLVNHRDDNVINVEHRTVSSASTSIGMGGVISVDETEHMLLVFGDCDDATNDHTHLSEISKNHSVRVHGKVIWVSYVSGSTLPLYVVLTCLATGLAVWYHRLMSVNAESRIQVEEWILLTLGLAAVSLCLQTILIATEVYTDDEILNLELLSDVVTSIAAASGRCLYLVLALGLGVATSALSKTTGDLLKTCLSAYMLGLFAMNAMDVVERGSIIVGFEFIVFVLDAVILVWIPCALHSTMRYLNSNGESLKLVRYQWILRIYFLAIALTLLQIGLFLSDMIGSGGRNYDLESVREGNQVIHLVVLACIAYLWRPNPSQQQYAYVLLDENNEKADDDYTKKMTDLELTVVANGDEPVDIY